VLSGPLGPVGALPPSFAAADQPFSIRMTAGAAQPAQLGVRFTPPQLDRADGQPDRLALARWTAAGWEPLPCARNQAELRCPGSAEGTFQLLVVPVATGAAEVDLPNGHFFRQANGFGGAGEVGYAVVDDSDAAFWSEFQRLGGIDRVGYPISQRFQFGGFLTQAFQKLVLQWRPELGRAVPVNVFDELHDRSADPWLNAERQVPPAAESTADHGLAWDAVVARHMSLLDTDARLGTAYAATPDAMETYGLPLAVDDYGPFVTVRLQRATLQLWNVDSPWAAAGTVVVGNGGDIAREAGLWPASAMVPRPRS
jgi:hypothetical protein